MKSAVGVHGTMLSNIVPVSSSERDKTFLLIPSSSNLDLKDACLLFIKDLLLPFFLTAPDLLKLSDFHFASHSRKGGGIGVV